MFGPRDDDDEDRGGEDGEERLEIDFDRRRLLLFTVLLLGLSIACLAIYEPWSRRSFVGWLGMVIVPFLWAKRQDRRPLLVLDHIGLTVPRSGFGLVPWSSVRRVRLSRLVSNVFLCIELDDMDRWLTRVPRWQSLWQLVSLARFGDEVRVDLAFAELSPQEVFAEVTRRCEGRHEDEGARGLWN